MAMAKKANLRGPQNDLANLIAHLAQNGYIKNPLMGNLGDQMPNQSMYGAFPPPPSPMPVRPPMPHPNMPITPNPYQTTVGQHGIPPAPQPMPQPGMTIHSDPRQTMQMANPIALGALMGHLPNTATYGGGPNIQGATPDAAKLAAIQSFLSPPRR